MLTFEGIDEYVDIINHIAFFLETMKTRMGKIPKKPLKNINNGSSNEKIANRIKQPGEWRMLDIL